MPTWQQPCGTPTLFNGPWNECPRGYQVGDVLTLVGGTLTVAATVTVTSINAETGSVVTISAPTPGNYTVFPANPVATTGGGGTGCTLTIGGVLPSVATAIVAAGGGPWPAGYRIGDILQIQGGTSTAPCTIRVNAVNVGGQITGIAIQTAGNYTLAPCLPAPVIGGHGCGAMFQLTIPVLPGPVTAAALANTGGPCHPRRDPWWMRTQVSIWGPGSGPPASPRATTKGMLEAFWPDGGTMIDACAGDVRRPLARLRLPNSTDANGMCCAVAGDVVEVPSKSGRLYNVWWAEIFNLDSRSRECPEYLGLSLVQQCPFGAAPIFPDGNFLVADDGVTVLDADPWHYLTPE